MSTPRSPEPRVSAVLITLDAAAHLRECLESLAWCDEIIVLDSGSRDATVSIAQAAGAQLHQDLEWQGFGVHKNRAIALACGDWIFSIDADEVVTPALRDELRARLATAGDVAAFELPRRSSFCGVFLRHGGWWPDRVTRVFRRGAAQFSDHTVHEHLIVDGAIARLDEPLLHYTYDTLEQALAKADRYSTLGARQAFNRGRRATPTTAMLRGGWAFIRTYVLRLGILDGQMGLILACYNAQTTYQRYLKLWLLGKGIGR